MAAEDIRSALVARQPDRPPLSGGLLQGVAVPEQPTPLRPSVAGPIQMLNRNRPEINQLREQAAGQESSNTAVNAALGSLLALGAIGTRGQLLPQFAQFIQGKMEEESKAMAKAVGIRQAMAIRLVRISQLPEADKDREFVALGEEVASEFGTSGLDELLRYASTPQAAEEMAGIDIAGLIKEVPDHPLTQGLLRAAKLSFTHGSDVLNEYLAHPNTPQLLTDLWTQKHAPEFRRKGISFMQRLQEARRDGSDEFHSDAKAAFSDERISLNEMYALSRKPGFLPEANIPSLAEFTAARQDPQFLRDIGVTPDEINAAIDSERASLQAQLDPSITKLKEKAAEADRLLKLTPSDLAEVESAQTGEFVGTGPVSDFIEGLRSGQLRLSQTARGKGIELFNPDTGEKEVEFEGTRSFEAKRKAGFKLVESFKAPEFNDIRNLRLDFLKTSKPFSDLAGNFTTAESLAEEATKGNLQAQQGLVIAYNKVLDAQSVVREGEFDRTLAARNLLDRRVSGPIDRLFNGTVLTSKQIQEIRDAMDSLLHGRMEEQIIRERRAMEFAVSNGADPLQVTDDLIGDLDTRDKFADLRARRAETMIRVLPESALRSVLKENFDVEKPQDLSKAQSKKLIDILLEIRSGRSSGG